jgi:hypothetical protein
MEKKNGKDDDAIRVLIQRLKSSDKLHEISGV